MRKIINDVVAKHPAWGKRLVYGWMREQGHDYSECTVHCVYRQRGHAAQWRKVTLAYIQPGKPWQNGFAESFVGTYRREVLNAEIFTSPAEGQTISTMWLHMHNTERPHSRHSYRPPITSFQQPCSLTQSYNL